MSTYAAVADVQARLSYATISASSTPTTTQVQEWIDEAEDHLIGILVAAGLPATYTAGTRAIRVLQRIATDYAEGRCRMAWASAQGDDNQDGRGELEKFEATLMDIRRRPEHWGEVLQAGAISSGAVRIRSHITSNPDGKTTAAGDFDPVFEMTETF